MPTSTSATTREAFHGADVLYGFGTHHTVQWAWTAEDAALADRIRAAWVSFARSAYPTDRAAID